MITEFAKITGISAHVLLSNSRQKDVVAARHVYWTLLHEVGFPYLTIARLNNRNHATVIIAIHHTKELLSVKDSIVNEIYNNTKHLIELKMSQIGKEILEIEPRLNYSNQKANIECYTSKIYRCPQCYGAGGKHYDQHDKGGERYEACSNCNGTGEVQGRITIEWVSVGEIKEKFKAKEE
ncbi:helix-turn-helix domain-containing protein [Dysgonomonas sp. 520]|uniref:helix-turn-helix domain-containing protein n=1 Tax=Dysgonomonas sp. 520 TaxID=2302931 RepID=UPI0013D3076D|nr:helix-turn-helix domain-containing protein [Dysgonomonas sp. 520]NDW10934.1 hypothetical protein [Dysgonomonas sp. 520]